MSSLMKEGKKFNYSIIMGQDLISGFQSLSGDNNKLHTDESYAEAKGFSGKVVYGNLLGLMLSYFVGEVLKNEEVMLLSQSIEYKRPVYVDDYIILECEVSFANEAYGVIEFKSKYKNQNDQVVAKGKFSVKFL
jgi:3-oxoacyl-[acyl-carrier protein] reductase